MAIEADDVVTRVLFDAVSQKFDVDIAYVYYPSFNDILTAVESGESDFAANVTYTNQRAARFDYSSPTNIEYTYLYSFTNATLETIKKVGIPKGTIYGALIKQYYPSLVQVEYIGHQQARQLLESGQVDGVVDAINQLKPMLLAGLDAQLLNHQISIKPVSLIGTKDKFQTQLQLFEQHLHSAPVQKLLRETVNQYQFDIRQKSLRDLVVRSGIDRSEPLKVKIEHAGQYAIYHNNGQVTGITPDVLYAACDILMLNCKLVSRGDETWEDMYADFLAQKIDIISPLASSEPRKQFAYFSVPYYRSTAIMIKREGYKNNVYSNVSELIVERIGVVKDDFYQELLEGLLPQKALVTYSSAEQQVAALLAREVDYVVISRSSYNKILRESKTLLPLAEDKLIGEFYTSDVTIGFAKNARGKSLVPLFDRAIKMLDLEKITNTHYVQPDWKATLQSEQRLARRSIAVVALGLIASILVSLYLHHQSNTDNLTRLKNRRALHRRYNKGIHPNLTLVYLDVNKFKPINDTFGHEVGDQVLKHIAKQIARYWKGQSYRIGGDEFILIGSVDSVTLSYALLNLQKQQFISQDGSISLDVSVAFGVSKPRSAAMSLEDVMHQADLSMYSNKRKVTECEISFAKKQIEQELKTI
ncbi:GGDEF domain protein [Vibrio ichthyoenteri ATCC 700023]|uniref:GGDEF domain protein n=1 Tax=Vibrio ichthyoenteri ATCC 700023 TaxID=870968 RepID=F9RZ71_9VIBR|nr:GGDEF domain protein [Vibrio ichthyoenteri ATCC 700023]